MARRGAARHCTAARCCCKYWPERTACLHRQPTLLFVYESTAWRRRHCNTTVIQMDVEIDQCHGLVRSTDPVKFQLRVGGLSCFIASEVSVSNVISSWMRLWKIIYETVNKEINIGLLSIGSGAPCQNYFVDEICCIQGDVQLMNKLKMQNFFSNLTLQDIVASNVNFIR